MADRIDWTELVKKAVKGNQEAFEALYNYTADSYRLKAKEYFKNEQDIEDALQESYIKIYKKLHTLKNPEKFMAWGRTVVSNTCLNMVNSRKAKDELLKPETGDETYMGIEDIAVEDLRRSFNPEQHMDAEENSRLISMILEDVPEVQRASLILWGEGKKYKEIAKVFGTSEGTAKSNVSRAKEKVKEKTLYLEKTLNISLRGLTPVAFFVFLLAEADRNEAHAATFGGADALFTAIWKAVQETSKKAAAGLLSGRAILWTTGKKVLVAVLAVSVTAGGILGSAFYTRDTMTTAEAQENPQPDQKNENTPAGKKAESAESIVSEAQNSENGSEEIVSSNPSQTEAKETSAVAAETTAGTETRETPQSDTSHTQPSAAPSETSSHKTTGTSSKPGHVHNWVAHTRRVQTGTKTVVDKAAWDETVVDQKAYDETVVDQAAYDEPVYELREICNGCGADLTDLGIDGAWDHIEQNEHGGYHDENVQTGTTHHDAVTHTVHHDAVTHNVHHDAVTHEEPTYKDEIYYTCSCGATK